MSRRPSRERGMTLLVALIMLIVITMFVVSMVKLNSTNALIVGNMRAQKAVDTEAQQQIEIALNHYQFFDDVINTTNTWASPTGTDTTGTYLSGTYLWSGYKPTGATTAPAMQSTTVKLYKPQCTYYETSSGYSALSGVAPQDTYWDMQVNTSDSSTGASAEVHQGIQIRLPPGNCK